MTYLKELASTGIGRAVFGICAFLAIAVMLMGIWVYTLKADIRVLKSEKESVQSQKESSDKIISMQSNAAELSKADEKKKEQLPERITKIEKVLIPVYRDIEIKKVGDKNESNATSPFWDFNAIGVFNSAATAADH